MSAPWETTIIGEVKRVCGYIKDDAAVASYFGVPQSVVETVRASLPQFHPQSRSTISRRDGASDVRAYLKMAEDEARCGSQRLNEALQDMFQRWEAKHGFQPGAGQVLLPAGWSEARQQCAA